jgi:G:T-mismatch repair DNA endonuclease (very short patch repair protein)
MRDRLTKERRSWNMSRIRGKNTTPEIVVRKLLHRNRPLKERLDENAKTSFHLCASSCC